MLKYLALGFWISLTACSEPEDKKDTLNIKTISPIIIAVGDTSPLLSVSRTVTGATGRTTTDPSYTFFGLVSTDPNTAKVVGIQRLVGMALGETTVKAKDEKSSLVSDSIQVKVIAKP
jgi:hypothetical protein